MASSKILDAKYTQQHIGSEIRFRDELNVLRPVEEYFIYKCNNAGIQYSYDCTANETTYFSTLNYTTYAGMFIIHPLCFSHQMFQMYDAKADNLKGKGHIEWLHTKIKDGKASKYVKVNGDEINSGDFSGYTDILIAPGSNKFHQHVSKAKIKLLAKRLGPKLLIKPHPVTNDKVLDEIKNLIGESQLADKHDNLYLLLKKADTVHTSHISETALTSLVMGKKITPMDPFAVRLIGSFSHINHFCFSETDPIATLSSIFASPKSGIIHPEVDNSWPSKIDNYFDYILGQRKLQRSYYYE